ncbi:23S rRNA (cytosine1962-C5)-methyltransferase [Terrimicrobium sacchariphilum]|uniref:23S rRNA (Cytosine1962-C5)-methyltransferase n=1 Tax=Terrimicrobium sacchariphilum TaxID=690879 RepID=A0A146G3A2_TERSA|nr:class I SAM-dependent rRNA methyltransferase [Terrimicrobium sacchariphilum]GAT31952.1 23S rRNA (cytosine1962-C5)-methyltransferase [Terrimicrobium sacchariphilum]
MAGLVIRPRARILHGHDWVYSSEVLKVFGNPVDGDVISIKDGRDKLLGTAIYNSKSQIVARRYSRRRQDLDLDFFVRRITQAIEWRVNAGCDPTLSRIVWSEADGLPGVVADRYGDVIVLQTLTLGMDQRKDLIVQALAQLPGVATIIERNDAPIRSAEGMELVTSVLFGQDPGDREITLRGIRFGANFLHGQKTGLYLDQADNYAAVARLAQGKRVLDCFSNQGGFALACALNGAAAVTAVESGAESARRLRENTDRNGVTVQTLEADVFEILKDAERAGSQYDLIILDPPSFTKARAKIKDAIRGYHELHLRAARLLAPHGLLATFSCSHHVSAEEFESTVASGLGDARRSARVLARLGQATDHPVVLHLPETHYLKGLIVQLMPGR